MLLALDTGSSKIALVAYDPDTEQTVASRTVAVDARLDSEPDLSLWDVEWFWQATVKLLRDLAKDIDVHSCTGLAVTGQQHGVVLVNQETLKPCSPFISWMDGRGRRKETNGRTLEETLRLRLAAVTRGELGCRIATGYAGLTLFDLTRKGAVPDNSVMLFLTDYINSQLSGASPYGNKIGDGNGPATDPTMAASSGLFDIPRQRWSDAALKELGLPRSLFPRVVPSGSRLGSLGKDVAAATGLPVGLPLYQGWGDNQASILGGLTACSDPWENRIPVVINYGTGTQVTVLANEFRTSNDFETRPFLKDKYILVRAEPSGGRAWSLLKDFFLLAGRELFDTTLDSDQLYERMNRLAAEEGTPKIDCRPRFFPSRHTTTAPDEKGSFTNIGADYFTPGEMIRALLAGMADESFEHWNVLAQAINTPANPGKIKAMIQTTLLLGSGNLFRKNAAFRSFVEKKFGQPVQLSKCQEEAAIGTALFIKQMTE